MSAVVRLLKGLNSEQREAVCCTEGPVLVVAGAGSGKTRVITTRIAYIIQARRAQPEQILGVTFTNKAAGEMRERLARLAGAEKARSVTLSTFHSFCARVLRAEIERLGYRRNFSISGEGDARTLVRRTIQDMDGVREAFDAATLLSRISLAKSNGTGHVSPGESQQATEGNGEKSAVQAKYDTWFPAIFERYQSALRAANTLDFDDLLLLTLRLWETCPDLLDIYRNRYRYVMVDEYQDTNHVQYRLLTALAGQHRNLCVVGDDDQSVYSWRGADIGNILSFEKDFPEAKVVKLEQNYRSTGSILSAANSVISNNAARRPKALWSALGTGAPIQHFVVADEESEAAEAVAEVMRLQRETGAVWSDFAILYRSNQQSRPLEIALRKARIPYVVYGGQDFFERAEIKDVLAYLKVLVNPRDESSFLRIVNVPRRGIGDATLHEAHERCLRDGVSLPRALATMLQQGNLAQNTQAGIREVLGLITEFRERFRSCNGRLIEATNDLVDRIGYRAELFRTCKSQAQFEARWSNVEALLESVTEYQTSQHAPTLAGFLDVSALVRDDDTPSRNSRPQNAMSLMTIHSAKGLEFPFVLISGIEEGLLPHQKSVADGGLEEERRLFYVALTRGKQQVILFETLTREIRGKRKLGKPSRFLGEIPSALVETHIRAARDMAEAAFAAPAPKRRKRPVTRRNQ